MLIDGRRPLRAGFERARGDLAGFQKRLAEAPVLLSPDGFAHAIRGA